MNFFSAEAANFWTVIAGMIAVIGLPLAWRQGYRSGITQSGNAHAESGGQAIGLIAPSGHASVNLAQAGAGGLAVGKISAGARHSPFAGMGEPSDEELETVAKAAYESAKAGQRRADEFLRREIARAVAEAREREVKNGH